MNFFNKNLTNYNSNIRLDIFLKEIIKKYSRNKIIKLIKNNNVSVNNWIINKPSKIIKKNDIINISNINKINKYIPINIPINIVYEDKYLIIINKQKNLIVHSSINYDIKNKNTLINSLIYHYPLIYKNKNLPNYGIIHRLDKNTTGLLIISKNKKSYFILKKHIKKKKILRIYKTIVYGNLKKNGFINKPIKRHKYKRNYMSINKLGKKSITYYKVIENFKFCTYLQIKLHTGRTHQIRTHMNYIKHPIIGEQIYTNKNIKNLYIPNNIKKIINNINSQMLHSYLLKFKHPIYKNFIKIECNLPINISYLIFKLRLLNLN